MSTEAESGEQLEGLETSSISGWGEYPLDSVFVRTETRTVGEVAKRIDGGRYDLNPEFQRDFVWSVEKQSRLIESCLMRIPLPVFYVAEGKDGRIIVVDGLQRLTTFTRFLKDGFALSGLGNGDDDTAHNPLLGFRFSELPLSLQERVEDTQLTLYILDSKAPERAKLDIFERVNGGVPLTRQQMRNCLFNGPATRWLKDASEGDLFLNATGRSLDKKSMRDREAINRFCAFHLLGPTKYQGDMDKFLAEALSEMNALDGILLATIEEEFKHSMQANKLLFREHAFRKSIGSTNVFAARSVLNIALFDVCSVLFTRIPMDIIESKAVAIKDVLSALIRDNDDFRNSITYSTNSTKQVERRFRMAIDALKQAL